MDNQLKAARTIVKHLTADLEIAKTNLTPEYHDDREALIVILEKALVAAKNVLQVVERTR